MCCIDSLGSDGNKFDSDSDSNSFRLFLAVNASTAHTIRIEFSFFLFFFLGGVGGSTTPWYSLLVVLLLSLVLFDSGSCFSV